MIFAKGHQVIQGYLDTKNPTGFMGHAVVRDHLLVL